MHHSLLAEGLPCKGGIAFAHPCLRFSSFRLCNKVSLQGVDTSCLIHMTGLHGWQQCAMDHHVLSAETVF